MNNPLRILQTLDRHLHQKLANFFSRLNPKCWHWQQKRDAMTAAYAKHPALLRELELEALAALAKNANTRIHIGFDKHVPVNAKGEPE